MDQRGAGGDESLIATHVIRSGRVYDPAVLFDSVRGEMGPKKEAEEDWWKGNLRLGR